MTDFYTQCLSHARSAASGLMSKYPKAIDLPPAHRWHYHQGVFLLSLLRLDEVDEQSSLYDYVLGYARELITADGQLELARDELDAMQAGNILFPAIQREKDPRYRKALDYIISLTKQFATTDQGGFWHKEKYPNQQWLDGLYMAGPICAAYAVLTGETAFFDMVCKQAELIYNGALCSDTGLLRHGFDRSKQAAWADPRDGKAPEVWGRALGWFPAALLDIMDFLPADHAKRPVLESMFTGLMEAIIRYQDTDTLLWHQVIDRGGDKRNWIESSCSCLFLYSMAKGIRRGLLDRDMKPRVKQTFNALLSQTDSVAGQFQLKNICIGTGIGNLEFYYARPTSINDLHGVGTFILACVESAKLFAEH